jgi:hypothetical protein
VATPLTGPSPQATSYAGITGPGPVAGTNAPVSQNTVGSTSNIHVNGEFHVLDVSDYVKNPSAIKTLINEKNALIKQVRDSSDPAIFKTTAVICAAINIPAFVLVGVGTNLITSSPPPPYSMTIFLTGIFLSCVTTLAPIIRAFIPRKNT